MGRLFAVAGLAVLLTWTIVAVIIVIGQDDNHQADEERPVIEVPPGTITILDETRYQEWLDSGADYRYSNKPDGGAA